MAAINRFEIGGIFYDCEDSDAQSKIAALQRQRGLDYSAVTYAERAVLSDTAEHRIFTATGRCQIQIRSFPTEVPADADSRAVYIKVNGVLMGAFGNDSPYPGTSMLGTWQLSPGDIVVVQRANAGVHPVAVDATIIPYYA